jgi:sterol desaturase/sphingolipid hydroxylase (fatty acid hydroxylase superfamily)
MDTIIPLGTTFAVVLAIATARYLIVAGSAWTVGYWLCSRSWSTRKIIAKSPTRSDVLWELRHSASTLLVFAVIGTVTVVAAHAGLTRIYDRIADFGWCWFWASLAAAIVMHDTYFYWTHRLMHVPWLFRHVHRTHHHSRNPTPWAAYSFSPIEAVIESLIFPLVVLILPMHPAAVMLFLGWQILFNVIGHAGFEYHPQRFLGSPMRFLVNTPTNHIMHHQVPVGNYGLYFNVWDRIMATNSVHYEERFRAVTGRRTRDILARRAGSPAQTSDTDLGFPSMAHLRPDTAHDTSDWGAVTDRRMGPARAMNASSGVLPVVPDTESVR